MRFCDVYCVLGCNVMAMIWVSALNMEVAG